MKKNAFTLIELLAVLVILGIISAISIAIYTNSISEAKGKLSDVQIKHIEESARTYVTLNTIQFNSIFNSLSAGSSKCVAIEIAVLTAEGLISSNIVDPKDVNDELTGYVKVIYDNNNHQYVYTYIDEAVNSTTCAYKFWVANNTVNHTS